MAKYSSIEAKFRSEAGVNPTNPVPGDVYFDTTNSRLLRYNGLEWTGILFGTTTSTSTTSSTSTSITTSTSTTSTSSSTTTSSSTSISTSTTTTI